MPKASPSSKPVSCNSGECQHSCRMTRHATRAGWYRYCDRLVFWIQADGGNRIPVSNGAAPPRRRATAGPRVDGATSQEQRGVAPGVPIGGRDKPNRAVQMLRCCTSARRPSTHARAASRSANGCVGNSGRYFKVRKSASEYGLSLLTPGRLNDGEDAQALQRADHRRALHRAAVIGVQHDAGGIEPLARDRSRGRAPPHTPPIPRSCTAQPTIFRLQTSSIKYK